MTFPNIDPSTLEWRVSQDVIDADKKADKESPFKPSNLAKEDDWPLKKTSYSDDPEGWAKGKKLNLTHAESVASTGKRDSDTKIDNHLKTLQGRRGKPQLSLPSTEEKNDQQEEQLTMFTDDQDEGLSADKKKALIMKARSAANRARSREKLAPSRRLKETQKIEGTKATWRAETGNPRKQTYGGKTRDNRELRDLEGINQGVDKEKPPGRKWYPRAYRKNPKLGYNPNADAGERGSKTGEETFIEDNSDDIMASGYRKRPLYEGENRNTTTSQGTSPTSASVKNMRDLSANARSEREETKTPRQQEIQRRLPDAIKRGTLRQRGEKIASRQTADRQASVDRRADIKSKDEGRSESAARYPKATPKDVARAAKSGIELAKMLKAFGLMKARQQGDGRGVDPTGKDPLRGKTNDTDEVIVNADMGTMSYMAKDYDGNREARIKATKDHFKHLLLKTPCVCEQRGVVIAIGMQKGIGDVARSAITKVKGAVQGVQQNRQDAQISRRDPNQTIRDADSAQVGEGFKRYMANRQKKMMKSGNGSPLASAEKPVAVMAAEQSGMYSVDGKNLENDPMANKAPMESVNQTDAATRKASVNTDSKGRNTYVQLEAEPTICSSKAVFNAILEKTYYDDQVLERYKNSEQGKTKMKSKSRHITNDITDTAGQETNKTRGI